MDRNRPLEDVGDVFMHVEEERDDGIVVSGAKVVATGSALTHFNFIAHYGPVPVQQKEFAIVCAVSMDTPGVKLICRASYEMAAEVMGSPFDYPLSSRLDENDAIFIFDKVLVPWENVFVYGDIEKANNFFPSRASFRGSASTGASASRSSSISSAGCCSRRSRRPEQRTSAACRPRSGRCSPGATCCGDWPARWRANQPGDRSGPPEHGLRDGLPRVLDDRLSAGQGDHPADGSSGLIYINSNARDFKNPEIRKYLDRYVRGSNGIERSSV